MKLTSNFEAIETVVILLITRSFENFTKEGLPDKVGQPMLRLTATLIASPPKAPSIQRFTLF